MNRRRDIYTLPPWAVRIRRERELRDWSQPDAVRALMANASPEEATGLPEFSTLLRRWREWEAGDHNPAEGKGFYAPIIARTLGLPKYAIFPQPSQRSFDSELVLPSGLETAEILSRMQRSDVDNATLEGIRRTVDWLCSEYPYMPAEQLIQEGRSWLRRVDGLRGHRLTLTQLTEVLVLAGWLALLVGCVENDMGLRTAAEQTRKMALSLGEQTGHAEIVGWAQEMRAWMALTDGDYRGVIAASRAGTDAAGSHGVTVQLLAQEAKAWARIGDRRQMEVALDRGRNLLDRLPYPENLDHHFHVDPSKYDFYSMDTYRIAEDDRLAEHFAGEVIRTSTAPDGSERKPMRIAEAHLTLGVLAARQGDVVEAVSYGRRALEGDRQSLPSLLMVSSELGELVERNYPGSTDAVEYLDQLRSLRSANNSTH